MRLGDANIAMVCVLDSNYQKKTPNKNACAMGCEMLGLSKRLPM
jgi:hypothetical protein